MTAKHYLLIALLIALAFGVGYCNRKKEGTPIQRIPAETERKGVVNTDSIKSRIEAEYLAKQDSIGKAKDKRFAALWRNYLRLEAKTAKAKGQYYAGPTIPACDTVIALQDQQIDSLKVGVKIKNERIASDSLKIASQAGTIIRKDSVIGNLNTGWQQANIENAELTRKVKNRNKVIKIGAGILAILAGVIAVR